MQQKDCCGKDINLKLLNAHTKISFSLLLKENDVVEKLTSFGREFLRVGQ